MNPNSNQRCGCSCRPQIPAPPCINTDCHCNPCGTLPPSPPPMPPVRPQHHNCGNPQRPGSVIPSVSQANQPTRTTASAAMQSPLQPGQPAHAAVSPTIQSVQQTNQQANTAVSSAMQPTQQANQHSNAAVSPSMHPGTSGTASKSCGCQSGTPLAPNGGLCQMTIGMAYVPWQKWSHTYPMEQGFTRGTIFPELDFPFLMGRCH